ncbi:MAG: hypothetical protein ACR2K4_02450 [Candidatus Limnocylindria bacterium]
MDHERDDQQVTDDDAGKSSGGLGGEDKSLSADGTTSGGIGSGANAGTGGDVGNWADAGSVADSAEATEGKEIVYPAGTGPVGSSDWNARQSGTGRDSGAAEGDAGDPGDETDRP